MLKKSAQITDVKINKSLFAILGTMFGNARLPRGLKRSRSNPMRSSEPDARMHSRNRRQGLHMINTRSGFQIMQRLPSAK